MNEPWGDWVIRPVRIDEADVLHALTQRSTMHWGYEPEFLDWEPEAIAVTPGFLEQAIASYVLDEGGAVTGYYTLTGSLSEPQLDKLFVDAPFIGTGRGRLLWDHALVIARSLGATRITLYADPHAAPFYRAMGAMWMGEETTSRPGWHLQIFEVVLTLP
ncbi:MAG: GNAT family N-acetyltransferase [Thermomicrobiales bacterium]|nr:GNAT family N-acetyltransferase [Thermomicrobiales bacterium]